ncbi:MAG: hypothetical protein R2778_17800 [Saprospiraceae bacterium]
MYEIQVVRDGCSFSKTIDITEHLTPPELAINGTIHLSCNGPEPALLTAFTNAPNPNINGNMMDKLFPHPAPVISR